MVGPISDEERRLATRRIGFGFVGFVGLSTGLMAVYGGANPIEVGTVVLAGVLAGVAILVALGFRP